MLAQIEEISLLLNQPYPSYCFLFRSPMSNRFRVMTLAEMPAWLAYSATPLPSFIATSRYAVMCASGIEVLHVSKGL